MKKDEEGAGGEAGGVRLEYARADVPKGPSIAPIGCLLSAICFVCVIGLWATVILGPLSLLLVPLALLGTMIIVGLFPSQYENVFIFILLAMLHSVLNGFFAAWLIRRYRSRREAVQRVMEVSGDAQRDAQNKGKMTRGAQ